MKKTLVQFTLVGIALFNLAFAQDNSSANHDINVTIPTVALIDIEAPTTTTINLGFTAPTEAGLALTSTGSNNTLWLNYSSIKESANHKRTISVKLSAAPIPGVDITLLAGVASSDGAGDKGEPNPILTLTAADQPLITNIGSAYTGDGEAKGHNLTYNLIANTIDFANLIVGSTTANVIYTIADQ